MRFYDYSTDYLGSPGLPGRPLRPGDYVGKCLRRPVEQLAAAELGHGQLAHVVAGQLERALAPDAPLRVLRKRCQTVAPREHRQIALSRRSAVEAAEGLIVLREAPDHSSVVLFVIGMRSRSMALTSFGQWCSRLANTPATSGFCAT